MADTELILQYRLVPY
ncbi:uncharacterized protein CPUR_07786 [Claviceps purpurea 20.1]|uniref:Uncharacterized protein n=1 Tax=Claviceps purpurea (strain 20.1) TaxID=1111077 RepID=M1WFQ1_CLAP2|nr:uncharacterized protein CPUR_07786 [Claviceps purpurea 20.1]